MAKPEPHAAVGVFTQASLPADTAPFLLVG
jgi:hypothetical protein